jgi:DNA-binding beta-propeller fold protein YncE
LKILNRWPLAPGTRPTGLGFDPKNRRLFSACGNQKMVIMNADNGDVLGSVNIGRGADGCVFDPGKNMAYSSNGGDGTVTAVTESEPGKYTVAATIPTQTSARTMTLDPTSHRLYLPAASVGPAPAGAAGQAKGKGGRRNLIPGSFVIVVVD